MRKRHIQHVVVTHERQVVGLIGSFDLLQLVEGHRYIEKNAPTAGKSAEDDACSHLSADFPV